jgi:hypothetical protein
VAAAAQLSQQISKAAKEVSGMVVSHPFVQTDGGRSQSSRARSKIARGDCTVRSASVIGTQFLAYVAVDSLDDANKVIEILEKA